MAATLADIIRIMDSLAPPCLAEKWDNGGLQTGDKNQPVRKIRIALDPLPEVVDAACRSGVDLLITHHPLIFKPLTAIQPDSAPGSILINAIRHNLAVFSAHTSLDAASGGVNDILAERIGLRHLQALVPAQGERRCKLVVYVPADHEDEVLAALLDTTAGEIGGYTGCTFRSTGIGTFKPGEGTTPFVGVVGKSAQAKEIRIETVVRQSDLAGIVDQVRRRHPYETMAYDVYPLETDDPGALGLGRVGDLDARVDLERFGQQIKSALGLAQVRIAGRGDLPVERVALCSGSGSSLLKAFMASGAQVYVSGDLHYHDARAVEAAGRGLVDIGHFASEHIVVGALAKRLKELLRRNRMDVAVEISEQERDPFKTF